MPIDFNGLEFETVLVLSTKHITIADSYMLSAEAATNQKGLPSDVFVVHGYPEGFWVYIPTNKEDLDDTLKQAKARGYSDSMLTLLHFITDLRDVGKAVTHLRLDRDGETVGVLPHHEW